MHYRDIRHKQPCSTLGFRWWVDNLIYIYQSLGFHLGGSWYSIVDKYCPLLLHSSPGTKTLLCYYLLSVGYFLFFSAIVNPLYTSRERAAVIMRDIPIQVIAHFPLPNYKHPKTRGSALLYINGILLGITVAMVLVRVYTRVFIKRWMGVDDWLIIIATVS